MIIGDIAGQYDALMRLVKEIRTVDKNEEIILVGDLIDRGPQSKEVVEWAMNEPLVKTLKGNHEDMFIDWYYSMTLDENYKRRYAKGIWLANGGFATLRSYDVDYQDPLSVKKIPKQHIAWMENLPQWCGQIAANKKIYISHAPYSQWSITPEDKLWNRLEPDEISNTIQVFGHNSHWGLKRFQKNGELTAVCIDDSRNEQLTAYDPELDIFYSQPYREQKQRELD